MVELPQGVVVEVRRGGHNALSQLAGDMSRLDISGHIRIERKPKDLMPRVSQIIIHDGMPKIAIHESESIKTGLDALLEIENDATTIDALISLHELSEEEIERVVNLYPDAIIFSDDKEEQKSHDQWWNQVRLQSRRWIRENRLPEMEATVEAPEIIRQKSQAQLKRLQGEDKKLNLGDVLLIDCEDSKLVFELSSAFAGHGRPILVVTRTHPNVLNREFDLPLNSCLWLSSKEEKGSILPDLDLLRKQIMNFLWANKQAIVAVDGLEYLASKSDYSLLMQFIRDVADEARADDHAVLLSCDLSTFDPIPRHNLTREVDELSASVANLWLMEGESLFDHPICVELSDEENTWIEQQLNLFSSRSGDFVETSSGEFVGGSNVIDSEDIASAGKNLAQVVEQWSEKDSEKDSDNVDDANISEAFDKVIEDSKIEFSDDERHIVPSDSRIISKPVSVDNVKGKINVEKEIDSEVIENSPEQAIERVIQPRKAIKIKRRRAKSVRQNKSEAQITQSSIRAAAQNSTELGKIESYDNYVPKKVGISENLTDYSNRQDLAFERTFNSKQESFNDVFAQAGKQKAAKEILNLPNSQYKQQVYFQLNEDNNDLDIAPLSSSNIAAASNNSKFARESASRKQNHVSVEQHYQNWTNENLSEERKSTSLFDSKGKPLSRVRGEENDDS